MRERQANRTYTQEFKEDALRLIRNSDRSIMQISRDLGISHWTLRGWYREGVAKKLKRRAGSPGRPPARMSEPAGETPEETIKRLEREKRAMQKRIDELEMDRAILKKAAAFFAKESE